MFVSNIYNSTRLEGINITYEETEKVLEGVNVPSLRLDEINCILNLRDAWNFTLSNIYADITLDFICEIDSFVSRSLLLVVSYDSNCSLSSSRCLFSSL